VTRPHTEIDQIVVDRFDVANASFWLDQVAAWLAEANHAERFAADQWPGFGGTGAGTGLPLQVIVGRAAQNLRAALRRQPEEGFE
jgi:hypothetical protein